MNIEDFIAAERQYFAPMQSREKQSSDAERRAWREETIRQRQQRISREVYDMTGGSVKYGPFSGMKLCSDPYWGLEDLGSQCLGLYELELLNIIDSIAFGDYQRFIDIGAADGYYTTGMLFSGKVGEAVCFEQSGRGRQAIGENWRLNGSPGKLDVKGCLDRRTVNLLPKSIFNSALILVDIEGGEFDLFTEDVLRVCTNCTLLIEIHNWVEDFPSRYSAFLRLCDKFFDVSVVSRVERPTAQLPELRDFTDDNRLLITSERRPCMMRFLRMDSRA